MKHFRLNQNVKISPEIDNENYAEFIDKTLVIYVISKNKKDHPGYDAGMNGEYLYDLKTLDGDDVPFSLYDYELIPA